MNDNRTLVVYFSATGKIKAVAKEIYPFATSGSSSYGKSNELIKESLGNNVVIKEGKLMNRLDDSFINQINM